MSIVKRRGLYVLIEKCLVCGRKHVWAADKIEEVGERFMDSGWGRYGQWVHCRDCDTRDFTDAVISERWRAKREGGGMPEHYWYEVNYGEAGANRWEAYDAWGNRWSAPSDRSAITIYCVSGIVGYGLSEQEAWAHVVKQEGRRGRILPHFEVPELQDPLQHHEYEDTWLDLDV